MTSRSRTVVCEDILHEIFLHLAPDWKPRREEYELTERRREARAALAACAAANRMLSDCALPFLWRVLDSMTPVMKILAGDSERSNPDVLDEFAWCRLQRYAGLVRELKHTDEDKRYPMSHPVWLALAKKLNGEPLFPSLERLEVKLRLAGPSYPLFFSPTIRTLDFDTTGIFYVEGINIADLTNALFPSLCSSSAATVVTSDTLQATRYLQHTGRWRELRALTVLTDHGRASMHYPTMKVLSTLVSLRELTVDVRFEDMDSHAPCRGGFGALDSLRVKGSPDDLEESLRMVASSPLRTLHIVLNDGVQDRQLTALLATLRVAAAGISSLSLQIDGSVGLWTPVQSYAELLEPVLPLRLEELTCNFNIYPHALSDADIAAFAAAWPDLRVLKIYDTIHCIAGITISALLELARRCPRLHSVFFRQLDVQREHLLPSLDAFPRMEHSVVRYVEFDRIQGFPSHAELWILACLLDRIFPHLVIDPDASRTSRMPPEVLNALMSVRASRCDSDSASD